jgi:hypothetical protein
MCNSFVIPIGVNDFLSGRANVKHEIPKENTVCEVPKYHQKDLSIELRLKCEKR